MKLASIINVWACCIELIPFCIKNHLEFCDGVIVVWSQYSNHGVKNDAVLEYILGNGKDSRVQFMQLEPVSGTPLMNETRKRNFGIENARLEGYTHFMIADTDEFWKTEEMNNEKKRFDNPELNGLTHPLKVYIKSPTLWCLDHTLVPGILKMRKDSYVGNF